MGNNDNYPAGVTDAHPHFNPNEHYLTVPCTAEEARVIPSFAVKAELIRLKEFAEGFAKNSPAGLGQDRLTSLAMMIGQVQRTLDEMEREGEYECDWQGELELPESGEAEWDCPRCGSANVSDTLPEGEDPDRGYEEMREARYDD